ncbi:MAG: AI-2E family transporter [Candidatus Falkowbacteria bacterium]|nr:AI-2E family transporter [Candidatus Falkowbacteria bacterium]
MLNKNVNNSATKIVGLLLLAAIGLFLVWKLSMIIILVITAMVLAATLKPLVNWFTKHFSLKISAALVMVMLVIPVIFTLVVMVPTFIGQVDNIANAITGVIRSYPLLPKIYHNIDITYYTQQIGQYAIDSTAAFTSFIVQLIILMFLTYYLLIDSDKIYNLFSLFIPKERRKKTDQAFEELATISGQYIRSNIFISCICATLIFIGLSLLHVPGAAALAVFAGLADLLPLVGATLGATPAVILAFSVSPLAGVLTIILFVIYQQVENDIIIPRVYHKSLKLIPFLSMVSVIIGGSLFGVPGAFLALPIAASLPTIIHYFQDSKKA